MSARLDSEVIIAGGGPVGLCLALLLSRAGVRVQVFESGSEVSLDLRASTLESADRTNTGARRRRREIRRPRGVRAPDLRTFAATRPMRYWLAERLLGSLETELGRAASAAERLDTVEEVRTLRIPAPMAAGAETRHG